MNFLRTLEIHYKIFDNSHLKLEKAKRQKIKNSMFDGPFLTSVGFLNIMVLQLFLKYSQSHVNLNAKA